MLTVTKTSIALLGWFLIMQSVAFGADLFQWTDVHGLLHFTDDFYAVPESVRHSADLIVRPGFLSSAAPSETGPPIAEQLPANQPNASQDSQVGANEPGPSFVTSAPQDVIVVVVNSGVQQPGTKSCVGAQCKRGFRPDFNHRWHVHSRVFAGGSHQFIHR